MINKHQLEMNPTDPWPDQVNEFSELTFDDNFNLNNTNINDINDGGLYMVGLQNQLNILEKKLTKLRNESSKSVKEKSKKMIKELHTKHEEILLQTNPNTNTFSSDYMFNDVTSNGIETLASTLSNLVLYETIGKKFFPQLQSINEEESRKLLNYDVLEHVSKRTDE